MTCGFNKTVATCHTARVTMDLLRGEFGLDYLLWGYVKANRWYTDNPVLIDELEDNVEAFIREIPAEMLEKSMAILD